MPGDKTLQWKGAAIEKGHSQGTEDVILDLQKTKWEPKSEAL